TSVTVAYIEFLKHSFWIPVKDARVLTEQGLRSLMDLFGGHPAIDSAAHDAISAYFTSLGRPELSNHASTSKAISDGSRNTDIHAPVGLLFWSKLSQLPLGYFSSDGGKIFRTWFQWIWYEDPASAEVEAVYEALYWSRLQAGILAGYAERRKYCLGILRRSLDFAARGHHMRDIVTPHMKFKSGQRSEYCKQYDIYCNLFETIVLDRYMNQVEACLPELSRLLGSECLIHPAWISTLLSAGLHSKVQDGVRKLTGSWYMESIQRREKCLVVGQIEFFIKGFLPWATQGTLFTSSLVSTREHTVCSHGAALANVVRRFISELPNPTERHHVLSNILRFILDVRGRMFPYAVLYLLQGLVGSTGGHAGVSGLDVVDVQLLLRVYRQPGLAEVAKDLSAVLCSQILDQAVENNPKLMEVPGYDVLQLRLQELRTRAPPPPNNFITNERTRSLSEVDSPLHRFLVELEKSQYKLIQGMALASACDYLVDTLDTLTVGQGDVNNLCSVLEAVWDEADTQEFRRAIAVRLPHLFFHPKCINTCITQHSTAEGEDRLTILLARILPDLHRLAESRSYLLSALNSSIRKACFSAPAIIGILPFEEFLVRFIENPPIPRNDFMFEVATVEILQITIPHRTYDFYYGQREWHSYACIIDLINRFPSTELSVAKRVFDRLIYPWKNQRDDIPIRSKWKNALHLQTILLLSEFCITAIDAESYLDTFTKILILEPWPRYRFVLEWIIARAYYRFPECTHRILPNLFDGGDANPRLVASSMKLAVTAASFLANEAFALKLMIQLVPFSASSKVQIRHEAQWSFPMLWQLAEQRNWVSILENPAFEALNKFIVALDKFSGLGWTSRTLKLDVAEDTTLTNIFTGDYMRVDREPERESVAREDFVRLWEDDEASHLKLNIPEPRIRLGDPIPHNKTAWDTDDKDQPDTTTAAASATATPLQTKSGFDLSSLHPSPPTNPRPAPLILLASLIDNPTNLGGLSRIAESFGCEALMVRDTNVVANKDFQATAVTSYKHLPIEELRAEGIGRWCLEMKSKGWKVVGVEQTDRSGILGEERDYEYEGIGTLPRKCVLVLGSERGGIPPQVLAIVDRCVEIRTRGVTRSLNVQTAAGIAVYEWWREWGGE
ncbi:hypothetical protein BCR34DRAFT_447483, partial [Clohesyomyces aquaticus]